jgi:hypothetical protein
MTCDACGREFVITIVWKRMVDTNGDVAAGTEESAHVK